MKVKEESEKVDLKLNIQKTKIIPSLYGKSMRKQWKQWLTLFFGVLKSLLEKAMAPHSTTLAWKIPWMEEPSRLQSMVLLRVGHD